MPTKLRDLWIAIATICTAVKANKTITGEDAAKEGIAAADMVVAALAKRDRNPDSFWYSAGKSGADTRT